MDVYRALWRQRFIVLFLTLATVVTTYVVVSRQTKMYRSSTLIRVQQQVGDPNQVGNAIGVAQHLAQTYAQIVGTGAIADNVYRILGGKVPRDEVSLNGQPVQDLELLYLDAKSSNPKWAADVANAAPIALRRWINSAEQKQRDEIQVVNPASAPATPYSPRVKLSVIIALLAGLIFNGGLAVLIEFLGDRIRSVDELETLTGKPVLATIPILEFRSSLVSRRVYESVARAQGASAAPADVQLQRESRASRG